jgi:acid phosphatase family membrane protein YuiD
MTNLAVSVILTWGVANALKPIITLIREKRISRDTIFTNGGMPSGHTSLVVSLVTGLFLETGFSPFFLTALVLAAIVIYDALRVRTAIEEQARVLNRLLEARGDDQRVEENVGHTPAEVLVSLILGIMIPILVYTLT